MSATTTPVAGRALVVAGVVVAVAVALVLALFTGSRLADAQGAEPAEDSVDAGFARNMQTHHGQAVQMSMLALQTSQDAEVRTLVTDVLLTQQQQAGQMFGWLEQWGLPQASAGAPMGWMSGTEHSGSSMGHDGDDASGQPAVMPGMATTEQLERLRTAQGAEADRWYLQLMIPHHQGAVPMAQAAADQAQTEVVRHLAQSIVNAQTAELVVLQDMLTARGGPVSGS